jgi:mRNA interferase MazF
MANYKQGDIVVMDFHPRQGHEPGERRPAMILSNDILNKHSALAVVCPIADRKPRPHHPFHIELDERTQTTGVILCDRAEMLDIRARNARFKEACPEDIWSDARNLVVSFF